MGKLPRQPDEATLEELLELARRLEAHPENRPGSDKTWVLHGLRRFQARMRMVDEMREKRCAELGRNGELVSELQRQLEILEGVDSPGPPLNSP
jgi:hypothetical protein